MIRGSPYADSAVLSFHSESIFTVPLQFQVNEGEGAKGRPGPCSC